jgi:hypothetical protein
LSRRAVTGLFVLLIVVAASQIAAVALSVEPDHSG